MRNDYPNALSKVQFFAASKFITWLGFCNLIGQDRIPSWHIKLWQECSDGVPKERWLIHETTINPANAIETGSEKTEQS